MGGKGDCSKKGSTGKIAGQDDNEKQKTMVDLGEQQIQHWKVAMAG